jgi:hypothetical protein
MRIDIAPHKRPRKKRPRKSPLTTSPTPPLPHPSTRPPRGIWLLRFMHSCKHCGGRGHGWSPTQCGRRSRFKARLESIWRRRKNPCFDDAHARAWKRSGTLMSTHQNGVQGGNAFISLSASVHASAAIGVNQAAQVLNLRVKTPPLALGSHLRPQTGHETQHALSPSLPTVCHLQA